MRSGKWATVVAGAVLVLNVSSIAQEQAVEPAVQQAVQPAVDPPAPPPVDPPPPPPADLPAPPPVDPPVDPLVDLPLDPPADPVATFSDINDAVPSRFFDAATTEPDAVDPNKLIIAIHSGGIDWTTWKATDFRASTASFSYTAAMDTISFRVVAPEGFYISQITYTQRGTGSILRTGKAAGGTHWVVGNYAAHLGMFGTNPTLTGTADFPDQKLTSVPVSITTGLFAFATPTGGSASLAVTGADVQVCLLPLKSQ